jgi:hypothetical protein
MKKHGGERPPDPANSNRPPGDKTTFWLGVVICLLLALITVVLLNRWVV